VLVVDDESPDGTGAVADALAASIRARRRDAPHGARGLGRSYIDGISARARAGRRHLPDGRRPLARPAHSAALIAATAQADVVIGSRYVPGGAIVNWPTARRLLSRSRTSTSAGDAARARATARAATAAGGATRWRRCRSSASSRTAIRFSSRCCSSARPRLRIAEVPITFVERRAGRIEAVAGGAARVGASRRGA
jgi:dolichol-phosphate mannosyltransferase